MIQRKTGGWWVGVEFRLRIGAATRIPFMTPPKQGESPTTPYDSPTTPYGSPTTPLRFPLTPTSCNIWSEGPGVLLPLKGGNMHTIHSIYVEIDESDMKKVNW